MYISVVVVVNAELGVWLRSDDETISQWRKVSTNKKHELRDKVDEILRPLGDETRLVMMQRTNNIFSDDDDDDDDDDDNDNHIVLYFICMTLAAVMSLRDLWRSLELRNIVKSLFNVLSYKEYFSHDDEVTVERLIWPLAAYERCLAFISSVQG